MEEPWYTPAIVAFLSHDVPGALGLPSSTFYRDIKTLCYRLTHEGESFLTKTLPALGKVIDLALQGHTPLATPMFKKTRGSALPAFLQALLGRVFLSDGWVRDDACITSIKLLRQLCYWCKKLQKGYSDESIQKATYDFIEVDTALPLELPSDPRNSRLLGVARAVIHRIFRDIGSPANAEPAHGPGAVSSGEDLVDKRKLNHSFRDLERVFRPVPFFRSLRDAAENPDEITGRMQCQYGLSRLAFVEKDSSGPRLIGLEPAEYMWCQQAIKRLMYTYIERHPLTRGRVNFTDQEVNRGLARNWSDFMTLDMSKASDRNSLALVRFLFEGTRLWPWLQASRTPGTVLPDGTVFFYKKFAPMGSAVCFPVQAVVYFSLAIAAQHLAGMPLLLAFRKTFVYGDDLVVCVQDPSVLYEAFESVGLKFNTDKCCTFGKFRESCGLDAYDGKEVTPTRLRVAYVKGQADFMKLIAHQRQLFFAGYLHAASSFRCEAEKKYSWLRNKIPQTSEDEIPILAWACLPGDETITYYYDPNTSLTYVEGWTYRAKQRRVPERLNRRLLRESLSLGGQIGELTGYGVRKLAEKYRGGLVKKRFTVVRPLNCLCRTRRRSTR
jgi:hypothetical protein